MQDNFYAAYQKELLNFVNSPFGREYLDITNPHKAVFVAPNAIHYHIKKNIYQAEFRTYDIIDSRLRTYIEIAAAERPKLLKDPFNLINTIHLATQTFNPNAGGSGSGRLQSSSSNNFTTVRNGNSLTLVNSIAQLDNQFSGGNYALDRDYHPFVTSSLPANANIISAFISYQGTAGTQNADSFSLIVVKSTQASFTTLATSDWGNVGSTSFGSITAASWNAAGTNTVNLNASGIANINKAGTSGFAAIGSSDFNNSAPSGVNIVGISSVGTIVLSVTYGANNNNYSFFM